MNVKSAADCATFCGHRQYCRTAVYNHEALTCAFSYDKHTECRTSKQRYNTFHLIADGAEPLSVLTCIDQCKTKTPQEDFLLPAGDEEGEKALRRRTIHPTAIGMAIDAEPAAGKDAKDATGGGDGKVRLAWSSREGWVGDF